MGRNKRSKRKAKKRNNKQRLPVIDLGLRQCGGCTACCTAMEVIELEKPTWSQCKHVSEGGCSIYTDRPESCREWFCFWRADGNGQLLKEHERPDKIGVIVEVTRPEGSNLLMIVREAWPGGLETPEAKVLVQRFAQISLTLCMRYGSNRPHIYGPADQMKKFMREGKLVNITPEGPETIWEARKESGDSP